jgi:archaemetzincin
VRVLCIIAVFVGCGTDDPRVKLPSVKVTVDKPVPIEVAAIGDTSHLTPALQRAFDPHGDFVPMGPPQPGDWLAEHEERRQTFADFLNADTNVPAGERRILYLLPIGEFPETAPKLAALSSITHAFFQVEVRTLPAVKIKDVEAKTRINDHTKKRQLLAPDVLTWLTKRLPADAFGLMAITMEDLYPEPSWNFVFGMASLRERVGVQSFARQDPAFFGEPRGADWQRIALRRATWTLVHEIGHMFGLTHCTYWECVQAGSNNQQESDRRPLHLCPVCTRKLHSSVDFDPAVREEALAKVLRELGIDDEAAWSERRAKWIREGKMTP